MRYLVVSIAILIIFGVAASASFAPPIANAGFEDVQQGNDAPGWGWGIFNGAAVSFHSDTTNPNSGKRCLEFESHVVATPHVYSRLSQGVPVLPETSYELSCWVRAEEATDAIHFTDWFGYTLVVPEGSYGWKRISMIIKTNPGQTSLNLGFNIGNKCKKLAIDDVQLRPLGTEMKGEGVEGSLLASKSLTGDDAPGKVYAFVTSNLGSKASYEITISGGGKKLLDKRGEIKPGDNDIESDWNAGKVPFGELNAVIRVKNSSGKVVAEASQKIQKLDSPLFHDIDKIEARLNGEFMTLYKHCKAKGIALDYPNATKTMLEEFIPLERLDVQKGENQRAEYSIKDFNRALDESIAQMKAYLADPSLSPNIRRYVTSKTTIDGLSFIGDRVDSKGNKDRGPVFLNGVGHFITCRTDIPRWPGYGINMIQIEVGPAITFPAEDKVDLTAAKDILKTLDNAAKHNVKVVVLLSPHYFPDWAKQKWPEVTRGGGGFLSFVPDEEHTKYVHEKFLRTVIPMFKGHPALHSYCLSNEPVLTNTVDANNTRPMWNAYLTKVHGNIETLNKRYGTSYRSFDEVPVGEGSHSEPRFYDWCSFNNKRFTAWHKWMADVIHSMDPDVPVHAKVMSVWLNPDMAAWGCDPELFGEMGQINGNDCYFMGGGGATWSVPWHFQSISLDIQRSVVNKPIFDSETHLTPDRSTFYVAPEHFRTALWQGAVHGQGASAIWVWERTFDHGYDFYGNIMDRPGCALATGVTNLDLNTFADEMTAVQKAKSPVAILYSIASNCRGRNYADAVNQAYAALSFHGFKVDFITEKQLQAGKGAEYKMLVFPEATYAQIATVQAIERLPQDVKLLYFGECLTRDQWGNPLPTEDVSKLKARAICYGAKPDGFALYPKVHAELEKAGALPEVQVVDAITGAPVWGLESVPAKLSGKTVISLINYQDKPANVKILVNGKRVEARDLLSLGGRDLVRVIKPATPVLAEF